MVGNGGTGTKQAIDQVDFTKGSGLVPVVVQDWQSRSVLMVGYVNREALQRTISSGQLHFWSRSRQELWLKGERSGNVLRVRRLSMDCDGDAILAEVDPATGETPICHTGAETCFFVSLGAESTEADLQSTYQELDDSAGTLR